MEALLESAKEAALEAGEAMMHLYSETGYKIKDDGSPVTNADGVAHNIIVSHLKETNIPVLSEESARIPLPYPPDLWIVDPLDGTKDFIHKTGDFAVMIGLIEHGVPVLGVVYVPLVQKLYYAVKGEGTFVMEEGRRAQRLTVSPLPQETLKAVRSRTFHPPQARALMERLHAKELVRGGIGVKAALICEREADFFLYPDAPLGEWDVCAPHIIVEEAGGHVTDRTGRSLTYGTRDHRITHGAVFSNGVCHEEVLQAIPRK